MQSMCKLKRGMATEKACLSKGKRSGCCFSNRFAWAAGRKPLRKQRASGLAGPSVPGKAAGPSWAVSAVAPAADAALRCTCFDGFPEAGQRLLSEADLMTPKALLFIFSIKVSEFLIVRWLQILGLYLKRRSCCCSVSPTDDYG